MEDSNHLPHDLAVESDDLPDLMEDQDPTGESGDQLHFMEDQDDFLRGLPFTRWHCFLKVDHKVKNTEGAKSTTSFFLDIKNGRQRRWLCAEGVATPISDFNVAHVVEFCCGNSNFLESFTERDTLVSSIVTMLELEPLSELQYYQISDSLLEMASTAKDEGYIQMDFVLVLEYVTVDTYDEEVLARDHRESAAFMSAMEAFSLKVSEYGGLNIHGE